MKSTKIIAVTNQKGGVGKTTTTVNLGVGIAKAGKRVLLIDADPQGSLTLSLGFKTPDEIPVTLATVMSHIINETPLPAQYGILHHEEGIDLLPANIELSALEVSLFQTMSRETILKRYLNTIKHHYDYILIDCMSSLGMITINSLTAADRVIIPSQPTYLSAKGLGLLLNSISKVKKQINPPLNVDGILLTMVDQRTNHAKAMISSLRQMNGNISVFDTEIPFSVRAAEAALAGQSIFKHDKTGKVAAAYGNLTKEVFILEQRERNRFRPENDLR